MRHLGMAPCDDSRSNGLGRPVRQAFPMVYARYDVLGS